MKYNVNDLAVMMTYMRPHNSPTEREFISKYIDKVSGMRRDGYGNRFIKLGTSETAFLSHVDTVHFKYGRHNVYIDNMAMAYTRDNTVLGADDTTGVWLMLNMIYAGVPGLYIFHRNEEHGGLGSSYIAKTSLLKDTKKAISLDRKGYSDVITHQGMTRTCSDKFAYALAKQLGGYSPNDSGVFTDSANYVYLVPECTNLSVGFSGAHTSTEKQDLRFAEQLYHKLRSVRWKSLPVERCLEIEEKKEIYKTYKPTFYGGNNMPHKEIDLWNRYYDFWGW
jgi:hypothetical protein